MRVLSSFAGLPALATCVAALSIASRGSGDIHFNDLPETFTSCEPVELSWYGNGTAPYTIYVYHAGGGYYNQSVVNDTSFSWKVVAAGGNSVSFEIRDSTGHNSGSTPNFPVVNGTDTSCVRCAGYMGYTYC